MAILLAVCAVVGALGAVATILMWSGVTPEHFKESRLLPVSAFCLFIVSAVASGVAWWNLSPPQIVLQVDQRRPFADGWGLVPGSDEYRILIDMGQLAALKDFYVLVAGVRVYDQTVDYLTDKHVEFGKPFTIAQGKVPISLHVSKAILQANGVQGLESFVLAIPANKDLSNAASISEMVKAGAKLIAHLGNHS